MRQLIRYVLSIVSASAAGMGGGACADIPEMSPAHMQEVATQILIGKVARIYSMVDRSLPDRETTYGVAELQVMRVEKGKHDARLAYVRFQTKRPIGAKPAPGSSGHHGIPRVGDTTRVFLVTGEDGGYDVLPPNGFTSVAKQNSGERGAGSVERRQDGD